MPAKKLLNLTKRERPKRPYRALIESLAKVWKISAVDDENAVLVFGGSGAPEHLPDPCRVAVWNICKGVGDWEFTRDFRHLLLSNDLLLAQEALLSPNHIDTYQHLDFAAFHGASYRRSDGLRDGVLTLAKCRAYERGRRILCKTPEPVLRTPKTALVTHHKMGEKGAEICVVNLHTTLFRTPARLIDELEHLLGQVPEHEAMIFAGDFNTFTPKFLRMLRQHLGTWRLEMVEMLLDGRGALSALDHVFVRGFEAKRAEVLTSIKSSDHFPLAVELSLR